ncbi:uncharacterized protein LOC108470718 [Gossypium arboreum]|uniref:Uncharacterized protein n=1 Tax=Gossypium arboreum TaxID=29729 RepID=A0ABR0NB72_GOSAR|nr:uncharacterized protein LOC108470718 [Gossypium arboreum]KAK5787062.1 hypothetical protein PVK06_041713 [Gossypium arboreum]
MKKRRELSFESIDGESVNHHHFQSRIKVNHETSDDPASPSPSQRLVLRLSRHRKSVFAVLPSPMCEPSYSPVRAPKLNPILEMATKRRNLQFFLFCHGWSRGHDAYSVAAGVVGTTLGMTWI